MNKRDELLMGMKPEVLTFEPQNVRFLGEGSPFAGLFKADTSKAYIEFEICHCAPVVAGPNGAGNFVTYHPGPLSRSHNKLLHQQTNLGHLIKAYDPEKITRDRIVGAVVATYYPPEPEGGWTLPKEKSAAIPIKVCAVVFKQAEGALTMMEEHNKGKRKWSVSIEVALSDPLNNMGLYIPSENRIVTMAEADDDLLTAVERDEESGQWLIRKVKSGPLKGEQLAFAYGAVDGEMIFQGVGYTPNPAEKEAKLTHLRMSADKTCMALRASAVDLISDQIKSVDGGERMADFQYRAELAYPGSRLAHVWEKGTGWLPDTTLRMQATEENPILCIELEDGRKILKPWAAVLEKGKTNFPKQGDDLEISLKNSEYEQFDHDFAVALKKEHPSIWGRGGNIRGNGAFLNWGKARSGVQSKAVKDWIREREAWAARHFKDKRLPGVVAQIKWGVVGALGMAAMKELVNEAKAKARAD